MAKEKSKPLADAAQSAFDSLQESLSESITEMRAANKTAEEGAEKFYSSVILKSLSIVAGLR